MLDSLSSSYPRASLPRHLALLKAQGDDLRKRMHSWITNGLRKGIPSLFKVLTTLFTPLVIYDLIYSCDLPESHSFLFFP